MSWQRALRFTAVLLAAAISVAFVGYIVGWFLIWPSGTWGSVSDYGRDNKRAVPVLVHWIAGSLSVTCMWLQLLRTRLPLWFHRWNGRFVISCILTTSAAGLYYTLAIGSVGGRAMDVAFFTYGTLLIIFCTITWGNMAWYRSDHYHRLWALRLLWLTFSAPFYRVLILPTFFVDPATYNVTAHLTACAYLMFIPAVLCEVYLRQRPTPPPVTHNAW